MKHPHLLRHEITTKRILASAAVGVVLFGTSAPAALSASSWNPTLLVNTEAFQEIDDGDGSSNIELRFGASTQTLKFLTTSKFQFSHSVSVLGNISGSTLNVDGNTGLYGNLTVSGTTLLKNNVKVRGNLSGSTLRVDSNADIWGALSATGAIKSRANITINSDSDSNDAVLTFGSDTTNETLTWANTADRFEFSDDVTVTGNLRATGNISGATLNVNGNGYFAGAITASGAIKTDSYLSGATLTVDGNTTLRGTTYTWPNAQGSANTYLKNDGAGGLSWATTSVGNGSGDMLSLHPEYPGAVYYASGATAVGQLLNSGSGIGENYYRWTTSRSAIQDYWIQTRVQVPKNFVHFEALSGITLRLRTSTTSVNKNNLTFRLIDTGGTPVAVTSNTALTSTATGSWITKTIGNVGAGTYTPLGYITLLMKVAATSAGIVDVGNVDLRWTTATP